MKGIDEDEAKKIKMQLSKKIKINRDAQLKKWADKQASNRTKLEKMRNKGQELPELETPNTRASERSHSVGDN